MALMRRQSLVKFDAPLCETIVDTPKSAAASGSIPRAA
jgi:alcohol dehydrogenase